ncbi:hypothetical protein MCUN1_000921 [Malassezia cuniculi]|uniref:Mediator of RNA polymerase II transcription subunit 21 n=1 Tax=Malassezia cuniculi TaxID=948313 RepID=A0AAF0ES77_9BASI|nr:hypothetical protein MCUN1_000921 [Malassezia cuniculi]
MDRVTQLEDAFDTLVKVMASAIAYLSRKASHKQVNARIPLTVLGNTEALTDDDLASNRQELVADLIAQAKDVQWRISQLPDTSDDPNDNTHLAALETELHQANNEYREAVAEARDLCAQLDKLVDRLCDEQQSLRTLLDD